MRGSKWGRIRSVRFVLEFGSHEQKQIATRKLKEILRTDPTFAYPQILAERHQLWEAENHQPTMFATAFGRALRTESIRILIDLEKRYPQWAILSTAARTLFSDENAASRMRSLLESDRSGSSGIKLVRQAVAPLVADEPSKTVANFVAYRSRVRLDLRDANEATVGEFRLAA
jgi:hypothetical protein